MLQQTQVARVVEKFEPFLERFPNPAALADADEQDVLAMWQGLGYYRRARNLKRAAEAIVEHFGGRTPLDVDALLTLPGIGRYTAGAIASIAGRRRVPIVDGNVLRVAARLRAVAASAKEPAYCADGKLSWAIATQLVEAGGGVRPGELNQAIMELGATLCAPGGSGTHPRDPNPHLDPNPKPEPSS